MDAASHERSSDQRPVGRDEAESTRHWGLANDCPDVIQLCMHSKDELVPIAPTHGQSLASWSKEPAFDLQLWPA